ncbi:MAG: hypothetical protein HXY46_06335 [Syntrophaceae bacterium]|nr:hypothetical protein [Syntrophaceae bacterium]
MIIRFREAPPVRAGSFTQKSQRFLKNLFSLIAFSGSLRKILTNIKLKAINKSIWIRRIGGERDMACGMKHPKAKKATKKATSKKK